MHLLQPTAARPSASTVLRLTHVSGMISKFLCPYKVWGSLSGIAKKCYSWGCMQLVWLVDARVYLNWWLIKINDREINVKQNDLKTAGLYRMPYDVWWCSDKKILPRTSERIASIVIFQKKLEYMYICFKSI